MTVTANPARGEVELKIDGDTFVLRGTFERIAKFQQASGFTGYPALWNAVLQMDARAMLAGIREFAISGPVEKLADMSPRTVLKNMTVIGAAVREAMEGPPEPDAGNASGATAENPN
jgi:hypothetical protein